MRKVNKLKDDARRHELREDWLKAIQAYEQVLAIGEQGESDLELPLYNRVGDLYVRIGRPNDAVRYYAQAADRYADAGLYNNAIALCNKALRYAPHHLDLLRKLVPRGVWLHDRQDGNGDAHLKAGIVGPSETIPIVGGELGLSRWQGIFLCEFDGPRRARRVVCTVIGDR